MMCRSRPTRQRTTKQRVKLGGDRGSVTVEAAVVLPVLVVVLMLCLGGIGCVSAQIRCGDAAREAARLVGRGDEPGAQEAVVRLAPSGATMSVTREADLVRVEVRVRPFSVGMPVLVVSAESVAAVEAPSVGALGDR